jgi:hypothetical protein
MPPGATIEQVLESFLDEQRGRLSARSMRRYAAVIEFLGDSLNTYGPNALDAAERRRWDEAFAAGDEDAFCRLFGPEHISAHLPEFLGHFMVRKVIAGQELLRTAGTVTKRLAGWLYEQGHTSAEQRDFLTRRGARAARDLPRAERLANLLYQHSLATPDADPGTLGPDEWVEDYLIIDRVEPGELYFTDVSGPLPVPQKASDLAVPGWTMTATLVRVNGTWRLAEIGSVYPH